MRVLVTGGAGYLGSVLVPKLLARGHAVRVVDVGYFGLGHLRGLTPAVELLREDLRVVLDGPDRARALVADCDCVIHLAAISNDPSAELNPDLTEQINVDVTARLAEAAKAAGARFLFSSSCSIYGEAAGEIDEEGSVNPLTIYAVSKVKAEELLGELATSSWRATVLRNGTLFGYSARMRFDLVVNIFSLYSTLYNEIKVFGDGLQWRPFLHVTDCARAFVHFVESRHQKFHCYNVANENLRVVDLVRVFRALNPRLQVIHMPTADLDRRDYRVSTDRLSGEGFRPRVSLDLGAEALVDALVSGLIVDPESSYYRNSKWLSELTRLDGSNHSRIASLIETLSAVRGRRPVTSRD